jgi:hypothetical protein
MRKYIIIFLFFINSGYTYCQDTLIFKRDKVIIDETVGIPKYAWGSALEMAHRIELESDIFEFDGFLSICFDKNNDSRKYSSDTLIYAKVGWILNPLIDTSTNENNFFYYDRYLKWWSEGSKHVFLRSKVRPSKAIIFMYYGTGRRDFFYDERYFLNTNSFEINPDFYIKDDSVEMCQFYKCKFDAAILNYNLEDRHFKVLIPVSEALEFRPINSIEAQSIGYNKINSVIVLE